MIYLDSQNFISVDGKTARNSYDEFFAVGEVVIHQDEDVGEATILSFEPDKDKNEVRANTNKGYAYIDFLVKIVNL
jgi:hypothetical protein